MVEIVKAKSSDASALAHASERAFHSDIHCGAPPIGGPPGYDSAAWQSRMMRAGDYYQVVVGGRIVGGMIIFRSTGRWGSLRSARTGHGGALFK